jgi:hypothetical protein
MHAVQVIWADGRVEHVEVSTPAARMIVPVPLPPTIGGCRCPRCTWRPATFRRELVALPDGMHGPFESHVLVDEETGRGYLVRYREELPS